MHRTRWVLPSVGPCLCIALVAGTALAKVSVNGLFSDKMVIQQGMEVPIWGTAEPGEKVTVRFCGQSVSGTTGRDGSWQVELKPLTPGGPFEMTLAGQNTITIKNVAVGEVWLAGGQSNMAMRVRDLPTAEEEKAAGDHPMIRQFLAPYAPAEEPKSDVHGQWAVCNPATVQWFSAAAYFFAKEIQERRNVPIGVINGSWGGTNAETWTPEQAFQSSPEVKAIYNSFLSEIDRLNKGLKEYLAKLAEWERATDRYDPGNKGFDQGWADPEHALSGWRPIALPGWMEYNSLNIDGVVWFRKDVQVPEAWAGKDLILGLGAIDDFDTTYFNGVRVGSTGPETLNYWMVVRRYRVPGSLVKAGRNVITVRVVDHFAQGGLVGAAREMKLAPAVDPGAAAIPLHGTWQCRTEYVMSPIRPDLAKPPQPAVMPGTINTPAAMYNGMIHPLIPYAIRGVIWYQGEANTGRAREYRNLFPALIRGWRQAWGEGDFPFLFVQLANFMPVKSEPSNSAWAELREAQLMTLKVPKTAMAVTIDIGDAHDIHPKNKLEVGKRLALAARAMAYGEKIVYSGPIYKSMEVEDDRVRLSFDHVGGGLAAKDGEKLKGFAIAGADGKFVWADARIDGDAVVVWSDKVERPVAVRYAWADNPIGNLYNQAGLPASPFRTDDW